MKRLAKQHITRRSFVAGTAMAALGLPWRNLLAGTTLPANASATLVNTPLGAVRGELSDDNVRLFRGIPFVEPPIGALRFRQPVKIKAWQGEHDATRFAASAMQTGEKGIRHSEDCLALNVWAPAGKGPFPVFVWIHGGFFTSGHAYEPTFDGAQFTREGIVVVTIPYRLGIFGFLDYGPLLGDAYAGTGNNAVRDVIAALEWVRDNIASFGGDPDRVTIGGESAGAKLTDTLMGVPSAQPLFHQMISESGGAERVWEKADAGMVSSRFGDYWQKTLGQKLSSLLSVPAEKLVDAQKTFLADWPEDIPQQIPLRPQVDGDLLPRFPIDSVTGGLCRDKRLLIGSNLDESALFIGVHPTKDPAQDKVGNVPLARFHEIYLRYKTIYPGMNDEQRRIRAVSAQAYWVPSVRVADAHATAGGKAWMYRLDFAEAGGRYPGYAYHSLDVGLIWNKPHADVGNAAAEATLSKSMHQAWSAFIRGESPAAVGLPGWPEYRANTRPTMILNSTSRVEEKPNEAELRLWDGVV